MNNAVRRRCKQEHLLSWGCQHEAQPVRLCLGFGSLALTSACPFKALTVSRRPKYSKCLFSLTRLYSTTIIKQGKSFVLWKWKNNLFFVLMFVKKMPQLTTLTQFTSQMSSFWECLTASPQIIPSVVSASSCRRCSDPCHVPLALVSFPGVGWERRETHRNVIVIKMKMILLLTSLTLFRSSSDKKICHLTVLLQQTMLELMLKF